MTSTSPAPLWTTWGKGIPRRCSPVALRAPSAQRRHPPPTPRHGTHPLPITFSAVYHDLFELGRGRSIDILRLASHPLLLLDPSFVLRKTFDAACRLARVRPIVQFECSSPHTLLALAEAGHGVAVVPSNLSVRRYVLKVLRITSRGRPLQEPLSIFWDKRRSLPRYAQGFCELLGAYVPEVLPSEGASGRKVSAVS